MNTNTNPKPTLAMHGGTPMFQSKDFERRLELDSIEQSVRSAIADGHWQQYHGDYTDRLSRRLVDFFQRQHAMLCCSGTIAVELALRGLGVKAGDEVLIAGYDFPGNFRAIEAIGALPVLVDVVEGGWTIDPSTIPPAISEKTKSIVISHLHGQVADIELIRRSLESHQKSNQPNQPIAILEDACQVPGGMIGQRPLGSFGDITTLSFGGSKLLTAGRGGAILTDDASHLQRIKVFAERGNDSFPLSELQAATVLPQLDDLKPQTSRRAQSATELLDLLNSIESFQLLRQTRTDTLPAFYKFPIRCRNPLLRDALVNAIAAEGVPVGVGFRGFVGRSNRRCRQPVPLQHSQAAVEQTALLHHSVLDASTEIRSQLCDLIKRILFELEN